MNIVRSNVYLCIATYDRNVLLEQLLSSVLRDFARDPARLIVVDNSPTGVSRALVAAVAPCALYLHEPRPGIAEARNAALEHLPATADAVVFVDDDEIVTAGWLEALVRHANETGADVVTGPVLSRLPADAPRWIVRGRFLQRESHVTGPYPFLPATNNTLVRAQWFVGERGARFDESFSLTGGSDTELFDRLRKRGAKIQWCNEALVEEDIPRARLTARWVWKRGVRSGNVLARIQLKERSKGRVLAEGVARLIYGVARVLWRSVRFQPLQYADTIYVMRGFGFFGAVLGRLHVEYARVDAHSAPES